MRPGDWVRERFREKGQGNFGHGDALVYGPCSLHLGWVCFASAQAPPVVPSDQALCHPAHLGSDAFSQVLTPLPSP